MKRVLLAVFISGTVVTSALAEVGFDVNVNIGNQPRVVAPPPPPPLPGRTVIIEDIQEPPEFIYPDPLGFYVAVGVPYDLFFYGDTYYLFRGNVWYRSSHYRGPWAVVRHKHLPSGLRRHKFERIRYYRDVEYRHYRDDHDRYRGKRFRPDKEWKEHRRDEKERWKEDKHREKDERREHRDHDRGHGRGHD